MKRVPFLFLLVALVTFFFAACSDDGSCASGYDPESNSSTDDFG